METCILKPTKKNILKAVEVLNSNGVIGMPTETVYGLAAVGYDSKAVKKIFEIKGRPADNPLIAHVHKDFDLSLLVHIENSYAYSLIKSFMPGPLTLVFKSKGVVCKEAVAGGDTLAIRMPMHKDCQNLLKEINKPLVAPSANLSKHTSPVTAMHVKNDLDGKISIILDGGKCSGGIESTVLDVTGPVPRILRAGLITKEMIESVVGACEIAMHKEGDKVKSPGVKYTHYKPKCDTALFTEDNLEELVKVYNNYVENGKTPYVMCKNSVAKKLGNLNFLLLGETEQEVAFNLYDSLLLGEKKADVILAVAMPNEKGVNMGIMNRLKKSCGVV